MRIVFLGSGEFAVPTLKWLSESEHQVPLVITQPARPSGRGRRKAPTPVALAAAELDLEVLEVERINDDEIVQRVRSAQAQIGVVIAFGQKLGPEFLKATPGGCVNLHASLLPKYRGAAPINWAILHGEERTGCTVFRVVERMDAGPILTTRWTEIKPDETAGELHDRLAGVGVDATQAAVELLSSDNPPEGTTQDDKQASRAPKLKKSDGHVRFDCSAEQVLRHIRGVTPWPGATARFEGADGRWEQIVITNARRAESATVPDDDPGTIDQRLYVAAVDGFIEIIQLKPSSGRMMTWPEYVNGRHVEEGDLILAPQ